MFIGSFSVALAASSNFLGQVWAFIQNPANAYGEHLWVTIQLSVYPIALAFVIALPLGIATARRDRRSAESSPTGARHRRSPGSE